MNPLYEKLVFEYREIEDKIRQKHTFLAHETTAGIWGPASLANCFQLFDTINLKEKKQFLDLGSGDGRIAHLASLFIGSTGIEYDAELHGFAESVKQKLDLSTELKCGDFMKVDLSYYDILFINPDTGFEHGLEKKILTEFSGILLVYNNLFLPRFMKPWRTYLISQIPIVSFLSTKPPLTGAPGHTFSMF